VQVRPKGRVPESATLPNLNEAKAWAISVEAVIREARHFPYPAARFGVTGGKRDMIENDRIHWAPSRCPRRLYNASAVT
jgi:hypothetical protein